MDQTQTVEYLKGRLYDYVGSITEKSRGRNMFVCPLCGSGTGQHGTGAFSIENGQDGEKWKCFACSLGGDIFDLIGAVEGITEYKDQVKRACEIFCISADASGNLTGNERLYRNSLPKKSPDPKERRQSDRQVEDLTAFFLEAHSHISETDYPQARGLSAQTVERFNLGYVQNWKHPSAADNPWVPSSPRLIIPTSRTSYLARDTRKDIPEEQKGYSKSKVGSVHIFNESALQKATRPIFIVEGEIDALSIIDVGGEAVALGSITSVQKFVDLCKQTKPAQPLIIALDNDARGEKAAADLEKGLQAIGISFYRGNPAGSHKDANEALQANRTAFKSAVEKEETITDKKGEYLSLSTDNFIDGFLNGISQSVCTPAISTGFTKLDEELGGGLYEGLYIMGAISSLGKTTLVLQIADQIAESGTDILIFSLEMARFELMAKSISRRTAQLATCRYTSEDLSKFAKTTRGITTGKFYYTYSNEEKNHIAESIEAYKKCAKNIYIHEGVGNVGAEQIRKTVSDHIMYTGRNPVVVVDYLQIVAPYNDRLTDKQNTDKSVLELKRISRDYKIPVIGISSFNRTNYKEKVSMESFKESGAIEYSSDVLIGLQIKGIGEKDFDINAAKSRFPRLVELVVLKNRNGKTGGIVDFKYYTKYNLFSEFSEKSQNYS